MNSPERHVFEWHHCIEQNKAFDRSPLLQKLKAMGLHDLDSPRNTIYLPDDKVLAGTLGVSPHTGGHFKAYSDGVLFQLNEISATKDGRAALNGDRAAAERVVERVHHLQDTLKVALVNGDVYTNTPAGMTSAQSRVKTQDFFDDVEGYARSHATQISQVHKLPMPESEWAAVVHSEKNVLATVRAVNQPSLKPTKGEGVDGHLTLRDAINQAHGGGRLTVSESSVTELRATFAPHIEADLATTERSTARAIGRGAVIKAVVGAGLVAGVVEAAEAGERTARSLAQDNPLAAQSQMAHYAGRGVGGFVGGAASGLAVGGWTGFGAIGFIAVGGVSGSFVGEKVAQLWDDHKVFNQTDREHVDWSFNGRQWVRDQPANLQGDSLSKPVEQEFSALPERARELSYKASNAATALALGNVEPPRDPYTLRAVRSDTASLQRADWERNPETGEWNRNVVVGFEQRGVPMTRPESATSERAAELNATSEQIIRDNIASGPAPIAARYELAYRAAGWQSFGEKLPAVDAALSADTLTASDGKQYRHNENGQWQREGAPGTIAQGNLQHELDNTRNALEPQIAQHKEQTATIPQWQPPTREEQDRDNLLTTYRAYGVQPDPEHFAAAMEAVERTRDAQGIDRATSSLSLERSEQGKYDVNSPINHLRTDSAGIVRVAAVTSPDEIALAMVDLRAPPPLIPDTPELRIAALSPQQREAHEQALREANREGLSHDQVQQVAQQATVQAASPDAPRAESIPIDRPPARTEAPSVTLSDSGPERERSFTPAPAVVAAASAVEVIPEPPQPKPEPPTQAETPPVAQPQAVAPDEAQPLTRSQPAASAPDAAITPPSAATPPQDDTLRPGSQGQDVELLQFKLQRVGYRGPEGEPLPLTGQYDAATEQAVRQFQRDQGMADTGMTDPATQQALSAAQHARIESSKVGGPDAPASSQEPARSAPRRDPVATAEPVAVVAPAPYGKHARPVHEHRPPTAASDDMPQVVRSPDRTAPDTPKAAPPREPAEEVTPRHDPTANAYAREPAPLTGSLAHATGYAVAPRSSAGKDEDQGRESSQQVRSAVAEPAFDRSQIPPRDRAMFDKIRNGAPGVSDETVVLAMLEAKRNGIPDADRTGPVGVANGTLWVGSVTPGYRAGVPENGPTPPIENTLRETQAVNQQYDQKQQQEAQEREIAQQNQKQTDAMRPEL
ncbi:peptidoglycan-binding protein [Lysobacter gummosus]|uniref:Peptidoglycan-binding protein n=1 Tax=Lysobacter gummosus TaxID=262324 RepID=A0ABY3XBE5_9GAMM|nr:peptidoglycan-binding protein [Lysobacter gummosus]ALN92502.1 putative peptidoglycan binding domain protein [Lysobacter gummosus]UNP28077.1 peptidoglycan-binding protein [Lysobacter gummosus]